MNLQNVSRTLLIKIFILYSHILMQVVTMNGSELLLKNAERYGLVLAQAVEAPRRLSRQNIGMHLCKESTSVIGYNVFNIIGVCYFSEWIPNN